MTEIAKTSTIYKAKTHFTIFMSKIYFEKLVYK